MIKLGDIEIQGKVVLAPMSGISNYAYIKICEEMGVSYAITELLSSEAIIRGNKRTFEMLKGLDKLKIPVAFQIFGANPKTMAQAAQILVNTYHAKIIDINMGCPVPKVALRSGAGSALLKDLDKVRMMVREVHQAVSCPITVKIRSGWDNNNINAIEVAKICEEEGASLITIHPRTRSQGYSGHADWSIIKKVKESVQIPVIGNGDIKNVYDAKKMLDETGCDLIMVGRGLLGNPWLISNINEFLNYGKEPSSVTLHDKVEMCIKHMAYLKKIKCEKLVCLEMRNHIVWYLKGIRNTNEVKEKIYKATTICDIITILSDFEEENNE